jgi:hypothetical protein
MALVMAAASKSTAVMKEEVLSPSMLHFSFHVLQEGRNTGFFYAKDVQHVIRTT